jgi:deoxyadenosine/deoxycytidine kinase
MGKLISIVGNLGAGKTTLTKLICDKGSFVPYWERPEERPFQMDFTKDIRKWAFANQMDFLLFRCEQELNIRKNDEIAVMDGGLDQDFHLFTKNLYNKGYIIQGEFDICERFYNFARRLLPPPDTVIRIKIDIPTLLQRRLLRDRKTVDQSFRQDEFVDLEILLDSWLMSEKSSTVIPFAFEEDFHNLTAEIDELLIQVKSILFAPKNHSV